MDDNENIDHKEVHCHKLHKSHVRFQGEDVETLGHLIPSNSYNYVDIFMIRKLTEIYQRQCSYS